MPSLWPAGISLSLAIGLALAGCGDAPSSPVPPTATLVGSVSPSPPSIGAEDLRRWTEFRKRFGLRFDLAWITSVATDPRAVTDLPAPLLPDEVDSFADQTWASLATDLVVRRYGEAFPDDWAGSFLDGPVTVARFSARPSEHEAALGALLGDDAQVRVDTAEWSLQQLEGAIAEIERAVDWFGSIGTEFYSADEDISENAVVLRYKGPNRGQRGPSGDAERAIMEHFGNPSWLDLRWTGPLPWHGPRGDVYVLVVDKDARPVADARCHADPEDPAAQEGDAIVVADEDGLCFMPGLPAVRYRIIAEAPSGGQRIGVHTLDVRPDRENRVTIRP